MRLFPFHPDNPILMMLLQVTLPVWILCWNINHNTITNMAPQNKKPKFERQVYKILLNYKQSNSLLKIQGRCRGDLGVQSTLVNIGHLKGDLSNTTVIVSIHVRVQEKKRNYTYVIANLTYNWFLLTQCTSFPRSLKYWTFLHL